jgi:hypothetical protein
VEMITELVSNTGKELHSQKRRVDDTGQLYISRAPLNEISSTNQVNYLQAYFSTWKLDNNCLIYLVGR